MKRLLFFYGSLKSDHGNNCILFCGEKPSRLIKKIATKPLYHLAEARPGCGYPGMTDKTDAPRSVIGEVWEIEDDLVFYRIERMELGAGYVRSLIKLEDDSEVDGYIYKHPLMGQALSEWIYDHKKREFKIN